MNRLLMLVALVVLVSQASPQSVLVILGDDIGQADYAEVSADGWTHNIDRLAELGVRFPNGYANPVCSPSRRSLLFGEWCSVDSGTGCSLPPTGVEPSLAATSLADLAKGMGCSTALFGKWHVGTNPLGAPWEEAPVAHGFDAWFGTPANLATDCPPLSGSSYFNWVFVDGGFTPAVISTSYQPGVIADRLLSWWPAQTQPKVVLWAPALAHGPFHKPPTSYLPQGYPSGPIADTRAKFKAMIAALDVQVGEALDTFAPGWYANGLPPDLLVFFIGDNGTPEQVAPDAGRAKTTTYERGIRVPFIVAGGGLQPGVSTRMAHVVDVLPTVAAYLGAPAPAGIDGLNLFGSAQRSYVICGDAQTADYCIRTSNWKLRHFGAAGAEELYDLRIDPNEQNPKSPDKTPAIAGWLRGLLYPEIP